jgi:paraquat-inducible protein B
MTEPSQDGDPPAIIRKPGRFQAIWLVPLVAVLIAGYLAYDAIRARGPTITITFVSAEGLQAGQTKVRHKAVELGVVDTIRLSEDQSRVEVRVKMRREATAQLIETTRFWVVRPQFAPGNVTGLETLLSGAYIEIDSGVAPGAEAGEARRSFTGLDRPPAIRSDEPGQTYILRTPRIGGISVGSPVLYRDLMVGEVISSDLNEDGRGFTVQIFVRKPYFALIHEASYFWNSSGVAVDLGANGVKVRLESLRALLAGAVAFETNQEARQTRQSPAGAAFRLYSDESTAATAGYKRRFPFLTRFEGSVRGLAVGAPVEIYGLQVGNVTAVDLVFDPAGRESHVDVQYEIQPERILPRDEIDRRTPLEVTQTLVRRGLRMQLHTANYLTGQLVLGMDFVPDAPAAEVQVLANGMILVPSQSGGLDGLLANVTEITRSLSRLPFDQIGRDLGQTVAATSRIVQGEDLRRSLAALAATMASVQSLSRKVDDEATPALRRLPEIAAQLAAVLTRATTLLASADTSYGSQSQVRRDVERVLAQLSDGLRSVRLLADYLAQHPEALIRGRSGQGSEK